MNEETEKTELRLDETNELFFKISVFGAERSPQSIRLVCELNDIAYAFKGKTTDEDGIIYFTIPPMNRAMKPGLYESRVEVIVDNHYFVPVRFNAEFQAPAEVVAETLEPQKVVAIKKQINIKAQSIVLKEPESVTKQRTLKAEAAIRSKKEKELREQAIAEQKARKLAEQKAADELKRQRARAELEAKRIAEAVQAQREAEETAAAEARRAAEQKAQELREQRVREEQQTKPAAVVNLPPLIQTIKEKNGLRSDFRSLRERYHQSKK